MVLWTLLGRSKASTTVVRATFLGAKTHFEVYVGRCSLAPPGGRLEEKLGRRLEESLLADVLEARRQGRDTRLFPPRILL